MKFNLNKNLICLFLGTGIGLTIGLITSYFTSTLIMKKVMYQMYNELSHQESIKEFSKETAEKMKLALQDSVILEKKTDSNIESPGDEQDSPRENID